MGLQHARAAVERVAEQDLGLVVLGAVGGEQVVQLERERGAYWTYVFFTGDRYLMLATVFDGTWDRYIDDFATKIPDFLDIIDSAWEGWPGIRSPEAKDYLVKHQITAEGWFVAHPDLTVAESARLKRVGQAVGHRLQPGAEAAADPAAERPRAGQDGRHRRRAAVFGELQLQVVDLAGQPAVAVDQLPVQQVQSRVEGAAGHGAQLPALVRTIRGMVTTATTSSSRRYSDPRALVNRELTLSPM